MDFPSLRDLVVEPLEGVAQAARKMATELERFSSETDKERVALTGAWSGADATAAGSSLSGNATSYKGASAQLEGTTTFDVIAAVLVGGTLISGGRGSALRTLAGAIIIATISDLLLLRGFDTGAQVLLKGVLVVLVVLATFIASGREGSA